MKVIDQSAQAGARKPLVFAIKKADLHSYTYIPSSSIVIFAESNQEKANFDSL
jgi:hypothetical protein